MAVPKAPVDEYGQASGGENEIGFAGKVGVAAPAGHAARSKQTDEAHSVVAFLELCTGTSIPSGKGHRRLSSHGLVALA